MNSRIYSPTHRYYYPTKIEYVLNYILYMFKITSSRGAKYRVILSFHDLIVKYSNDFSTTIILYKSPKFAPWLKCEVGKVEYRI